jgi:hypothetical protein
MVEKFIERMNVHVSEKGRLMWISTGARVGPVESFLGPDGAINEQVKQKSPLGSEQRRIDWAAEDHRLVGSWQRDPDVGRGLLEPSEIIGDEPLQILYGVRAVEAKHPAALEAGNEGPPLAQRSRTRRRFIVL